MLAWGVSQSGRRIVAVLAAAEGGASKRRSQRLRQQGRPSRRPVEEVLLERGARFAEQQQQLEQQQGQQQQPEPEVEQADAAAVKAATDLQEEAARLLIEELRRGQGLGQLEADEGMETPASLAADGDAPSGPQSSSGGSGSSSSGTGAVGGTVVEADYIVEQEQQLGRRDLLRSEINRQSEILLEIIQAGEQVEEVIEQHRADIDATMLKLLEGRIRVAKQLEKQAEAVQGLELLHRRLKAEIDRQQASPSLRLLDELLSILDPEEGVMAPTVAQEERRRQAAAHLRASFSGGFVGEADVLSLAAQLSGGGGSELADQMVSDPVDPMAFLAETTELLNRVQEQESQLEQHIRSCGGPEQAAPAELMLQQRRAAAALVQQCIEMAQAFAQQI